MLLLKVGRWATLFRRSRGDSPGYVRFLRERSLATREAPVRRRHRL